MGVSLRSVQDWEQGRRKPSGPAEALLRIADQRPDVFLDLLLITRLLMTRGLPLLR